MPTAYVTAPPEAAADLAELLVEERLAACVNIVDCRSVYRWEGELHDDEEVILLAKTTEERYDALAERVVAEHPHDVPCVERVAETDALPAFAEWRAESVTAPG
jgi:periplasmic divalent cation tolerance protein